MIDQQMLHTIFYYCVNLVPRTPFIGTIELNYVIPQ